MDAPSALVRESFGAEDGDLIRLTGGQGTAWAADAVVLKPLDMPLEQLEWQAMVLTDLRTEQVRIAVPVRSRAGDLVVDGWTAWPRLAGSHHHRWLEIISAGDRFHEALGSVRRPSFLDRRQSRWATADRVACDERDPPPLTEMRDTIDWLISVRREMESTSQLIHGDLSGNVLFADGLPPAVIDFSPYWRPTAYASAIVVVDAIAWQGAEVELMGPFLENHEGVQMLVRALLFRLLSDSDPAAGRYLVMIASLRRARYLPGY